MSEREDILRARTERWLEMTGHKSPQVISDKEARKATKSELRCIHSYSKRDLLKIESARWCIYICEECLNDLTWALSKLLTQVVADSKPELKVSNIRPNLGAFCNRCEQYKLGVFYQTRAMRIGRLIDYRDGSTDLEQHEIITRKPYDTRQYCEECWFELQSKQTASLLTRRNIYIPAEIDEKVVENIFADRLEKTDKILTLVPTVFLRKLINQLPPESRKEVVLALPEKEERPDEEGVT